jgi:prepilin-type N-terminal cleavage/methylation domain-containing protein
MRRRRAVSLVEVLVALSIGSTVMTLAVGTIHQAMLVVETTNQCNQWLQRSNYFFEQFRKDVHLGKGIDFHSDQSLAIKSTERPAINYIIQANHITREQKTSDGLVHRDEMKLLEGAYAMLYFDELKKIARLSIYTRRDLHQALPRLDRDVEAILSRVSTEYHTEEPLP